jgi:hypothetical protein
MRAVASNPEASMAKISRRKLIAGAAVAPLALNGAAHAAPAKPAARASITEADPIVVKVAAWMAAADAREAMLEQWSDLDAALIAKRKAMKLSAAQARRERLPETRAMRALDRKIKAASKKLDRDAGRIVVMRSTSAQGALAKIRLGLRIQGPYDWNDDIVEALVQDGCEHLALLLAREA